MWARANQVVSMRELTFLFQEPGMIKVISSDPAGGDGKVRLPATPIRLCLTC